MQTLRDLLPKLKDWHFLNYAGTGPLLSPVIHLLKELAEEGALPIQLYRDKWLALLEDARMSVARLIGADVDEIAFTMSTSASLSLVANAIYWKEGDRILYPSDEFPSNRYVWDNLIRKGVKAEEIPLQKGISLCEQLAQMDLSRVRLLSFSLVSYWDGRVQDVAEIVRFCRERGILVAVDAIQALGAIPFNVKQAGCDFLATGGQKWLFGQMGVGFLYIRKERIDELFVPNVGWASVERPGDFEAKTWEFSKSARRFEAGSRSIPGIAALGCSIETLAKIGWPQIYGAIAHWNQFLKRELKELGYPPLHEETQSGIVAIRLRSLEQAEELKGKFKERKVILVQRGDYLRVSPHASASKEDLCAFLEVLGSV